PAGQDPAREERGHARGRGPHRHAARAAQDQHRADGPRPEAGQRPRGDADRGGSRSAGRRPGRGARDAGDTGRPLREPGLNSSALAPFKDVAPPAGGRVKVAGGTLQVPDDPVIPYVEGDGTGRDIWRASARVFDAAVQKSYGGRRRIVWFEVLAGEKAFNKTGEWMPADTLTAFREYLVGIKGPLTTPVGGGIRSLNVALRQELDLYVCLRPVRYFPGVPSPVKRPEDVDMVIFRENTEDIYAGIEWAAETPEAKKAIAWLRDEMKVRKVRFPETSGIGIKPVSREGTERLVRAAIRYALKFKRKSLSLVHKGNIMKFTEGAFRDWGYAL